METSEGKKICWSKELNHKKNKSYQSSLVPLLIPRCKWKQSAVNKVAIWLESSKWLILQANLISPDSVYT